MNVCGRPTIPFQSSFPQKSPLPQHFCPVFDGFCCSIYIPNVTTSTKNHQPSFITRHPLPQRALSFTTDIQQIALPYAHQKLTQLNDLNVKDSYDGEIIRNPYISTIREIVYSRPQEDPYVPTPRMFDFLLENDCLPTDKNCHKCLRSSKPDQGSCENCSHVCKCYCDMLCNYRPPEKFISKDLWVRLPLFRKDPERLIPRIIHQVSYLKYLIRRLIDKKFNRISRSMVKRYLKIMCLKSFSRPHGKDMV